MMAILKGALIFTFVLIAGISIIGIDVCQVQVIVVRSDPNMSLLTKDYIVKMLEGHASSFSFFAVLAIISIPVVLVCTKKKIIAQGFIKRS